MGNCARTHAVIVSEAKPKVQAGTAHSHLQNTMRSSEQPQFRKEIYQSDELDAKPNDLDREDNAFSPLSSASTSTPQSSASTSTPQLEESGSESVLEFEPKEEEGEGSITSSFPISFYPASPVEPKEEEGEGSITGSFPVSFYPATGEASLKSAMRSVSDASDEITNQQRHISFKTSRENSVHCSEHSVPPYGEVYGMHPGCFIFDAAGNKIIGFNVYGDPVMYRDGVVLL